MRSYYQLVAAIAFSLTGCHSGKTQAEELTRANLKDPGSAQFGRFAEVLSKNRDWACLGVNAKNSFGGYTGEQAARFVRTAGTKDWQFDSIAPQSFDECVSMIKEMQPYEGGAR